VGGHWLALARAAFPAVSRIRFARVSGFFACTIHWRIARFEDGGNDSQRGAELWRRKAAARSGGDDQVLHVVEQGPGAVLRSASTVTILLSTHP
jgi:hypothetical protein